MKKILFFTFALFAFLFVKEAKADILYQQLVGDGACDVWRNCAYGIQYWNTPTNFGSTEKIKYLSIWAKVNGTVTDPTCGISPKLHDEINNEYPVSATTSFSSLTTSYQNLVFTFPTPLDLSIHELSHVSMGVPFGCALGGGSPWWVDIKRSTTDVVAGTYSYGSSTTDFTMLLFDENSNLLSGSAVAFSDPPFRNGMVTPDFQYWIVNPNISTSTITGFYYTVEWGTSTPDIYTDSLKDYFGIIPLSGGSFNENVMLEKGATSTPGDYTAKVYLYDQDDNFLAVSETLSFTVSSGTVVFSPSVDVEAVIPPCGDTSFDLLGVDFGQGLCNVGRFLLIPSKSSIDKWVDLVDILETKIPFSYFYDVNDAVQNASNPNGTSTPTLTYSATNSPVGSLSINPVTAVQNTVGSSNITTIKTVTATALWFAFAVYLWFRIKGLI